MDLVERGRIAKGWLEPRSAAMVAAALAIVIYALVGTILYQLIPQQSAQTTAAMQQVLLFSDNPAPEPKERYTYIFLVLLTPLILAAAVWLQKHLPRLWLPSAGIFAFLVFGMISISHDMSWPGGLMVPEGTLSSVGFFALICAAQFAWFQNAKWRSGIDRGLRWATFALIVFGVAINVVWRVFDYHTVTGHAAFFGHFDAVAYSLVRIAQGATCLVDIQPQYGCYGEFLAPLFAVISVSVLSLTLVMAVLQAFCFLVLAGLTCKLLTNPMLRLCAIAILIIVLSRFWGNTIDQNFQNLPVRLLFPVISLWAVFGWRKRMTMKGTAALGIMSGLAVAWNLDSGAVVLAAVGLFIAAAGSTRPDWQTSRLFARIFPMLIYLASALFALLVFVAVLTAKGGRLPDFAAYFLYQSIFFGAGIFELPMTLQPGLWQFMIAIPIAMLSVFAGRIGGWREDDRVEYMAYAAVLTIGLFSYYVGRSHSQVLAISSWPFVFLLFFLIDRAWPSLSLRVHWKVIGCILLSATLAIAFSAMLAFTPRAVETALVRWNNVTQPSADSFAFPIAFIQKNMQRDGRVAVFTPNQATILAETNLQPVIPHRSLIETLRVADAKAQLDLIRAADFDALYLGFGACCTKDSAILSPWLADAMPALAQQFQLTEWDPSGQVMRLVEKREPDERDLFALYPSLESELNVSTDATTGRPVGTWGRPVTLQEDWHVAVADDFVVRMRFWLGADQPAFATVVTNRFDGPSGFSVEMISPEIFQVFFGDGNETVAGSTFPLAFNADHELVITSVGGRISVRVDGKLFDAGTHTMQASALPIRTGQHYFADRNLVGSLIALDISGTTATD